MCDLLTKLKIDIRFPKQKELDKLINLSKEKILWENDWNNEKYKPLLIKDFKKAIRDKCFLVAYINNELIGQISWAEIGTFAYFEEIIIKKKYQRQKIGTLLAYKAFEIVKKRGYQRILTDTWVKNIKSLNFQHSLGLVPCGYVKGLWDNCEYIFSQKKLIESKKK